MDAATKRLLRDLRAFVVEAREVVIDDCTSSEVREALKPGEIPKVKDITDDEHTAETRAEFRQQGRLIDRIDAALKTSES